MVAEFFPYHRKGGELHGGVWVWSAYISEIERCTCRAIVGKAEGRGDGDS
jgi:hypothetical protein